MSQYKYVSLYSCEKKDKTNLGAMQARVDFDNEDDFRKQKAELKEKQKLINLEYRKIHPLHKKKAKAAGKAVYDPLKGNRIESQSVGVNKVSDLLSEAITNLPDLILDHPMISSAPNDTYQKGSGNSIVILGSSKAGKTHVMKAIYDKYFKDVPKKMKLQSILFSINAHADVYKSLPSKVHVCNKFDSHGMKLINQMKKINMIEDNKFNYLIMLDDIIDAKYSTILNNLILTYRNSNFSSIVSLQYPYLLSKGSRSSINQCIFGAFNTDESIESVIKSFLGSKFSEMGFHTMPTQIAIYKKLTADYHFLYYYPRKDLLMRFKLVFVV